MVPLDRQAWLALLRDDFVTDDSIATAFDQSRVGSIILSAGQFGRYQLDFERLLPALRWRVVHAKHRTILELDDDSDSGVPAKVRHAPFDRPQEFRDVAITETAIELAEDSATSGLYQATVGTLEALAVIPPTRVRSLGALRLTPAVSRPQPNGHALKDAVENLDVWVRAPLPGNALARTWRAEVVRALHDAVLGAICGDLWLAAERLYQRQPTEGGRRQMQRLVMSGNARTRGMVQAVLDAAPRGSSNRIRVIAAVASLVRSQVPSQSISWRRVQDRHGSSTADWLAEFYLRLATDPRSAEWAGTAINDALECALIAPLPLRVCRFLALTTSVNSSDTEETSLVGGWSWS
jgi:hypothetical protein